MATELSHSSESFIDVETPVVVNTPQSLSKALYERRSEYLRPRKLKVKIGTWNVAACSGTEKDLGAWFTQGLGSSKGVGFGDPSAALESRQHGNVSEEKRGLSTASEVDSSHADIYVLGLQEIVDLASVKEYVGKVYTDLGPMAKWRKALSEALPETFQLVSEQQLSGLLLLIFASAQIAPTISSVSSVSVGTGIMGYLGNKGAVATRIVLSETTKLVFVNSHLTSGVDQTYLDRRCWDVKQIVQRTQFDPINWGGVLDDAHEGIGDEDFAFWFGDLNFRLGNLPGEDVRRILMLHTKGEYDLDKKSRKKINEELNEEEGPIIIRSDEDNTGSSEGAVTPEDSSPYLADFALDPSQDPGSLQATLESLLPHDQLRHVQAEQKAFHDGWQEGSIKFLPTYKYDVGSVGMFDSSEKRRAPSWCDRILYRNRDHRSRYIQRRKDEDAARLKDQEMQARGIDQAAEDESVLFDYDPDEDGQVDGQEAAKSYDEYQEESAQVTIDESGGHDATQDTIQLCYYDSHQNIVSSDHKPLEAVFTLAYDAVEPDLKSAVQREIARELDRAENEGRPDVTVIIEHSTDKDDEKHQASSVGGIDFGHVAYLQHKSRNVTIANTSQVTCRFAFVKRPTAGSSEGISPPWLNIFFPGASMNEEERRQRNLSGEITLQPGEAVSATVDLLVNDLGMVTGLNRSTATLDDVLVVSVVDGRDHFVPVKASWLPSCLGRSIDELIRTPRGGVRSLAIGNGTPDLQQQEVYWSVPRELVKLTEFIGTLTDRVVADTHMLDDAQIPRNPAGWPFHKQAWTLQNTSSRESYKGALLEALDCDTNLANALSATVPVVDLLEIASEVLILFLQSLTDRIVPESLWIQLEKDISARGARQLTDPEEIKGWVLDVLSASPNHNISFVFTTSMLARVLNELAPIEHAPVASISESVKGGLDSVRRSLSLRGRPAALPTTAAPLPPPTGSIAIADHIETEAAYVEVFATVIFPDAALIKDKERRLLADKRKTILSAFLQSS